MFWMRFLVSGMARARPGGRAPCASLFSGDYYDDARLVWILLVLAAVRPAREVAGLDPGSGHPKG